MMNNSYPLQPWMMGAVQNVEDPSGNPYAISPAGAQGPMQIMAATARQPGYGVQPLQGWDGNNPATASIQEQMRFGNDYLQAMSNRFQGNPQLTAAAYNAGPGRVGNAVAANPYNPIASLPAETQAYVPKVMSQAPQAGFPEVQYAQNTMQANDAREVTDPALLQQLEGSQPKEVTDPALLAHLEGQQQQPQDTRFLADEPGYEYGSMLPFAKNKTTGDVSLAVPEMLRSPIRGVQDLMGQAKYNSQDGRRFDEFNFDSNPDIVNAELNMFGPALAADSRGAIRDVPPSPDASIPEKMGFNLDRAQQNTRFSGPTNSLQAGMEANQAISHQYGIDTQLQRDLYSDVNTAGSKFSAPAPEVYSKLSQLTGYLKDKVAVESPEYRAYTELNEIGDNLANKYGIAGTPDKTVQLPSMKRPMVLEKGTEGQQAYAMQPSDAVDIKTTLNQLARSGKFTNAGQAKILEFKSYIQSFLDQAKETSPEFADALDKAETQAARVGAYKDPKLAQLWSPKDYMSYKGGNEPSAQTFDRGANFMGKLNAGSPAAGEAYSLTQILPHEQLQDIFRNALLQNKEYPSLMENISHPITNPFGLLQSATNPFGLRTWASTSPKSPLLALGKQVKGAK